MGPVRVVQGMNELKRSRRYKARDQEKHRRHYIQGSKLCSTEMTVGPGRVL